MFDGDIKRTSPHRLRLSSTIGTEALQWYFQKLQGTSAMCSGHPSTIISASANSYGSAAVVLCMAILFSVASFT